VISVNSSVEIEVLRANYPFIHFVESAESGAPYVSSLLKAGLDSGAPVFGILNSDIRYRGDRPILKALFERTSGRIVYANRWESAAGESVPSQPYLYGFDVFLLDRQFADPQAVTGFRMGMPWWDYLLLYDLASKQLPMSSVRSPLFTHLTHPQNWDGAAWRRGLELVSERISKRAREEGPIAALLGQICKHYSPGALPGYMARESRGGVGVLLGTAMVAYVREHCDEVLWAEPNGSGGGYDLRVAHRRT
jgi:hypothetical protein